MMPQSDVPYSDLVDQFFSLPQQDVFHQTQVETLFRGDLSDQSAFSSNNGIRILDDQNLFDEGTLDSVHPSNPSTISTSECSYPDLGYLTSAYPTPRPISPQPYPSASQQAPKPVPTTSQETYRQRQILTQSQTNTDFHPNRASQSHTRRRSLSHSGTDYSSATHTSQVNPTFVRLQASRSRPEQSNRSRSASYYLHGRSPSQGACPRGRPLKDAVLTSVPYGYHGDHRLSAMMETCIGTPLDATDNASEPRFVRNNGSRYTPKYDDDTPLFRRMHHPDELERSRQVIEIGIMAVSSHNRIDSDLIPDARKSSLEQMVTKLEDLERYLEGKYEGCEDALKGCAAIKERLKGRHKTGDIHAMNLSNEDTENTELTLPGQIVTGDEHELFGGNLDNADFISMLTKENERNENDLPKE